MPTSARHEFVEDAGVFFERLGLSRTAGRIVGWLLSDGDSDASADAAELCAALAVAKSSMSVALRQLEGAGLVEPYRAPGQRRMRYRLADDVFGRAFRVKMAEFDRFDSLVAKGLEVVGDAPAARERLQLMAEMYRFMAREFAGVLDRWDRESHRAVQRPDTTGSTAP